MILRPRFTCTQPSIPYGVSERGATFAVQQVRLFSWIDLTVGSVGYKCDFVGLTC